MFCLIYLVAKMKRLQKLMRCLIGAGLACSLMVLGGCAHVFSAQLDRYQQWPMHTMGAYYWIVPTETQKNNLQFQASADTVRAAIGATGLVEAQSQAQARFMVHIDYDSRQEQIWRQQTVDPYFYAGNYGHGFGFHHVWGYGPVVNSIPVTMTRLSLSVRIDDQAEQGREVYRATASTIGGPAQQTAAMPYLARALFDHFPGHNGQVVEVRYPITP